LFGHRPVVDGYGSGTDGHQARWVVCRRCGVRPGPQGSLDATQWQIGQRYRGPLIPAVPPPLPKTLTAAVKYVAPKVPGLWPDRPTTQINGQLVVGRGEFRSLGVGFKVGNASSENALDCSVRLGRLGALYLSFGNHGRGVQRRLNSRTYESRVVEVTVHDGSLWWKVWAPQDSWAKGTPRWMDGSTVINPLDRWLGPVRASYEDVGPKRPGRVLMPEGDVHEVTLQLQRQRVGRKHSRPVESWVVDWEGRIPFRNDSWKGDEILGSSTKVSAAAVDHNRWAQEACAQIAAHVARDRARYRWRGESSFPQPDPDGDFDVQVEVS
jgi:hypothetical protein